MQGAAVQATVRSFDPAGSCGSVFLDDGTVVDFGASAFAASGLRLLRRGQRVALRRNARGAITAITLATFALAPQARREPPPGMAAPV